VCERERERERERVQRTHLNNESDQSRWGCGGKGKLIVKAMYDMLNRSDEGEPYYIEHVWITGAKISLTNFSL
jgi:hypothetical protein